jgi:hypothetical protein
VDHHLPRRQLAQAEGIAQHLPLFVVEQATFVAFGNEDLNFGRGVGMAVGIESSN